MKREVVFVFGSNLAGRHGKGAAFEASRYWGAEYGVGEGRTGDAYALPTKDHQLNVLPLPIIGEAWGRFWDYADQNPAIQFLLTPFGTGLAGYTIPEIRSIMTTAPLRNIWECGDWRSV